MKTLKMYLTPLLMLLLSMSLMNSCGQKSSKKSGNTTSASTNPLIPPPPPGGGTPPPGGGDPCGTGGPGESYGTGNEPGVADAGQTIEYYRINNPPVVVHGAGGGEVVWSSRTDLSPGISENIFFTNSRFNVRVIPRRQYFGYDSRGVSCLYQPRPYQKLQVGVQLRKRESSSGFYHLFDNVAVDGASRTYEFPIPQNTQFPLVLEVLNVKWEYSCQSYCDQGYPNVPGYCPWDNVWSTECVQIELQFSTDDTKDIPGQREF